MMVAYNGRKLAIYTESEEEALDVLRGAQICRGVGEWVFEANGERFRTKLLKHIGVTVIIDGEIERMEVGHDG